MGKDVVDIGPLALVCGPYATPTRSLRLITEINGTVTPSDPITDSQWATIRGAALSTYGAFDAAVTGIVPSWWAGVAVNDRHNLQTCIVSLVS